MTGEPESRELGAGGALWAVRCSWLAAAGLFAALASAAHAQTCGESLQAAQKAYSAGHFEQALEALTACTAGKATRLERRKAFELQAKIAIATDDRQAAVAATDLLLRSAPDFVADPGDSIAFAELVEDRRAAADAQVSSVSKVKESLREAPATVQVVTAEQIRRRGYTDLEAVLHDLPGFDFSRGNGDLYSSIYMRGYRSNNDRFLFLVDGIEQNTLHATTAHISRQYALSSIARIEVVYGPASTLYGANAYAGVISVITKTPDAILERGKNLGVVAEIATGSYATRIVDMAVAGRLGDGQVKWMLSGRKLVSDEPDLSRYPEWDYDYAGQLAERYRQFAARPYTDPESGRELDRLPTEEEVAAYRAGDEFFVSHFLSRDHRFSDPTDDWSLRGDLAITDLSIGFQVWERSEGSAPWRTDSRTPTARHGSLIVPRQLALFAAYSRSLGESLSVSFNSRYKQDSLGPGSGSATADVERPSFRWYEKIENSNQFKTDLTLVWEPSNRFSLVTGGELRRSAIQGDFSYAPVEFIGRGEEDSCRGEECLGHENPFLGRKELLGLQNLGLYAQAGVRPWPSLKLVAGARLDHETVGGRERLSVDSLTSTTEGYEFVSTKRRPLWNRNYATIVRVRTTPASWVGAMISK